MKRITTFILVICAMTMVSCSKKEVIEDISPEFIPSNRASFKAYIAEKEVTKTTYLSETTFNWVGNEIVSMDLINNSNENGDRFDFYIPTLDTSDKTVATFESAGSLSLGPQGSGASYRLGARAYYPGAKTSSTAYSIFSIGSAIKTATNSTTVNLSGIFKPSIDQPMRIIPMIGNNDGNDNFVFHSATGVLKVTVTGIDYRVAKVVLRSEGQQLSGTFNISSITENEKEIECYKIGSSSTADLAIEYIGRTDQTQLDYYFPVPVGTLNAGFRIIVYDLVGNVLKTATYPNDVPITRNHISALTKPIVLDLPEAPDAQALYGKYGYSEHNFVLSDTDNSSKGNIMVTEVTGKYNNKPFTAQGKVYGYYDGSKLFLDGCHFLEKSTTERYCLYGPSNTANIGGNDLGVVFNVENGTLKTSVRFGIGLVNYLTCDGIINDSNCYYTSNTQWSNGVTLSKIQ